MARKSAPNKPVAHSLNGLKKRLKTTPHATLAQALAHTDHPQLRKHIAGHPQHTAWVRAQLEAGGDLAQVAFHIFTHAQVVELSYLELTTVPELVFQTRSWHNLILDHNRLTTLPPELAQLEHLHTLDVSHNQLTALPPKLAHHPALTILDVSSNAIRKAADKQALYDLVLSLPALRTLRGLPGFNRRALREILSETLELPPARRKALLALALDDPALEADPGKRLRRVRLFGPPWSELSTQDVLRTCSDGSLRIVRLAHAELARRSQNQPVTAGSEVALIGSTSGFKRTELKDAVSALGATYQTRITPATTHVIVGARPGESKCNVAPEHTLTFLTQADAEKLVVASQKEQFFLDEDSAPPEAAESILDMLLSDDTATLALALDLIGSSGLPTAAETGLFVAAKDADDKAQRAKARKLAKRFGSDGLKRALAERSAFYSTGDRAEKKTREALSDYARLAKDLDWIRVARYVRAKHGYGLSFALPRASSPERLNILREHVKDGALDYQDLVARHYRPSYDNPYAYNHYTGSAPPSEIFELTELTELNLSYCLLNTLPSDIAKLTRLKRLNLRGNMLTALPDALATLPHLEDLDIGNNELPEVPPILYKLPALKRLNIFYNRRGYEPHRLTVEKPKMGLSDCKITDG